MSKKDALRAIDLPYATQGSVNISGVSGGGSVVVDHGSLGGLTDDDHSQYHNDTRGDARYYGQSYIDSHTGDDNAHHAALIGLKDDSATVAPPSATDYITIAGGNGIDTAASGSTITVNLSTPGTLTVSTANSAANRTHAITASSAPGAAASLLKTTASGGLTLQSLGVTGAATVGEDFTVGAGYMTPGVLFVDVSGESVGFGRAPDPQFMVDVNGPLRADYLIGPHAIQLDNAELIAHFDGPRPYETNFDGFATGHMGQPATITGGVIYREGKFEKSVQVASATTNLITNPSFETNTTGWASAWGDTLAQDTSASSVGDASLKITAIGAAGGGAYFEITGLTTSTDYTFSADVWAESVSGTLNLNVFTSALTNLGASDSHIQDGDWHRLTVTVNSAANTTLLFAIFSSAAGASQIFRIDAAQVEATAYATPYADGSLGDGHTWSGTAHASTSSRTAGYFEYGNVPLKETAGTFACWIKTADATATVTQPGVFNQWDTYNTNSLFMFFDTNYPTIRFSSYADSVQNASIAGTYPQDDEWHHVAVSWSVDDGMAIYVDGALMDSDASFTAPEITSDTLRIGTQTNTGRLFSGLIDDIVVLNRAAPADEIMSIYESNAPVFAESSVFAFRSPSRSPVWVDEEGLWMQSASGNPTMGVYGSDSSSGKSWGGLTLYDSDFVLGNSTAGYLAFRSGVDSNSPYTGAPVLELVNVTEITLEESGTEFLTLDNTDGINIADAAGSEAWSRGYSFSTAAGQLGGLFAYTDGGSYQKVTMAASNAISAKKRVAIEATSLTSYSASAVVTSYSATGEATVIAQATRGSGGQSSFWGAIDSSGNTDIYMLATRYTGGKAGVDVALTSGDVGTIDFFGASTFDDSVHIDAADASTVGLTVNAAASASVAAQEWEYNGTMRAQMLIKSTQSQLSFASFDNGSSYGPVLTLGRNNDGSTPASGWIQIHNEAGTIYKLWVDTNGKLRIGTSIPTSANDTSGTVVGTQT